MEVASKAAEALVRPDGEPEAFPSGIPMGTLADALPPALSLAPGLPEPLGCSECQMNGRHTGHTIRTIESAGLQATSVLQRAIKDACRTRQVNGLIFL